MVQIFLVKSGRRNLRGKTSHSHDLVLIDRISQDSVLITITRDISWSSTCDIPPTTDISWSTTCDITPNVRKEFALPENLVRVGPSFYCANPRGFEISFTCRQGYLSRVFKSLPGFNFCIPLSRVRPVWWHLWCQGWHEGWSLSVSFVGDLKMLKCFDLWCSGAVSRWSTLPAVNRTQLAPPLTPPLIS